MNSPDGFWNLQFKDILSAPILLFTVIVIYFGPFKVQDTSEQKSARSDVRRRKLEILGSLMKTRKMFLSPEHVMALNTVQLEFKDDAEVIGAYKEYIRLRNTNHVNADERFFEEVDSVFFDLIHAIALNLGINFDKSDLKRFSYAPQGWVTDDMQLREVRSLMIEVLSGRKAIFTMSATPSPASDKFPPRPE